MSLHQHQTASLHRQFNQSDHRQRVCSLPADGVRQVGGQFTHNTFGWEPQVEGGAPFDWAKHYSRARITDNLPGVSCVSEVAFFGFLNRPIVRRDYSPSAADFAAAKAAWVPGGVLSDDFGANSWLNTWGTRSTLVEGTYPTNAADIDLDLFTALLAGVNWNSIPKNGSLYLSGMDPNPGYTAVADFSSATLLGLLSQSVTGILLSGVAEGPTSALDFTCPARFLDGFNTIIIQNRFGLRELGTIFSNFPPVGSRQRWWGRYLGVVTATKVGRTHSELAFIQTPGFTNYIDPFENNPFLTNCALDRPLVAQGRACNQPPRVVLPPSTPGMILIPSNPAAFPC